MLGTDTFMAAWRKGAEEWNTWEDDTDMRGFFFTRESQKIYNPVGLTETDLGKQYGSEKNIVESYNSDKNKLVQTIIDSYSDKADGSQRKGDFNTLGIIAAQLGRYSQAESAFKKSLAIDRNSISPQVNLGNVYLLLERYFDAIQVFHAIEESLIARGRENSKTHLKVLINLSRAYYELENFDKAAEYYDKVATEDSELADSYDYLARSDDTSRSANVAAQRSVIFVDEEE